MYTGAAHILGRLPVSTTIRAEVQVVDGSIRTGAPKGIQEHGKPSELSTALVRERLATAAPWSTGARAAPWRYADPIS